MDPDDYDLDLGSGVYVRWDDDGKLLWTHTELTGCKGWAWLTFEPDPRSTGHRLISRDPLTIEGSLLCPIGCGAHGWIHDGRWVPA
jgi:hypothetical protein